jgi:hypothetical protein
MNKVSTDVKYVEINGKHLIAHLELIDANDDQFEISLNSPYAEGAMLDAAIAVIVDVDIVGYDRRNPDQEIVVQREEEIELSIDDIESADIQFDVVHRGALESDPLPMLTDMETMICLGEDAKVVVKFELK